MPGAFMPDLRRAGIEQRVIGRERTEFVHHLWQTLRVGAEVPAQCVPVRENTRIQVAGEPLCELCLAAALVGQGEQLDHDAAGLSFTPLCQDRCRLLL